MKEIKKIRVICAIRVQKIKNANCANFYSISNEWIANCRNAVAILVIPAQAGILLLKRMDYYEIPACAGMTGRDNLNAPILPYFARVHLHFEIIHPDFNKIHLYFERIHLDFNKIHLYFERIHPDFSKIHLYFNKIYLYFSKIHLYFWRILSVFSYLLKWKKTFNSRTKVHNFPHVAGGVYRKGDISNCRGLKLRGNDSGTTMTGRDNSNCRTFTQG